MSGKKASKSKSPARKSKPEGSPSAVASESAFVANKSKPSSAARKVKAKKDSGTPAAVNLEAQSQGQGEVAQGVKTRKQKLKTAEAQEQGKDKKQKTGTKKIAKKSVAPMHFDEDDGPHAYSMYTSAGGDAVDECLFRFYRETDLSELKSESELYGKVDAFLTKNMPKKHSEWSDTASREEILETVVARWKSVSKKSSAKKQTATKPDPSDDEPDDDKPQEDADDDTPPEYDGESHSYSMFSDAGADAVDECLGKFQNSVNLASIKTEDELFDKMYEFFQKHMPKKYSEWSDTASRDQIFESLIGQWEDAKAEVNA